jgi:hypothetical protein
MEPDGSLPYLQQPATGPCPEPDASSPHLPTLFSYISTCILKLLTKWYEKPRSIVIRCLKSGSSDKNNRIYSRFNMV